MASHVALTNVVGSLFHMAGENQVLARKAGAIDAVVAAMKAHVGNVTLSVSAKRCLDILRL